MGETDYARRFLLVRAREFGDWECCAISTDDYNGEAFEVRSDDPDFPATGLDHTSYFHDQPLVTVKASELRGPCKGKLEGELLNRFRAATGL